MLVVLTSWLAVETFALVTKLPALVTFTSKAKVLDPAGAITFCELQVTVTEPLAGAKVQPAGQHRASLPKGL